MTKTLKENLIAAKALISDPSVYQDKERSTGSASLWAFEQIVGVDARDSIAALFATMDPFWAGSRHCADIMAIFDSAIAAQGEAA